MKASMEMAASGLKLLTALKKKAWLASETSRTASGLSGLTQDEKLSMPLILIDGPSK